MNSRCKELLRFSLIGFLLAIPSAKASDRVSGTQEIVIDGNGTGRIFEGIGGVSAGPSSRLLIDYPEQQRREVLDFLFRPLYGASLQHLKVEIGSDCDSTDGSEPSFARTREEFLNPKPEYFARGYEFWLMKEAKARNPRIFLEALEWGAPGWLAGPGSKQESWYSRDNQDYIAAFVKGAKTYHGLDIDYVGIWNERFQWKPAAKFIPQLRRVLDENGLQDTKIVAADDYGWDVAKLLASDPEVRSALAVFGVHYPRFAEQNHDIQDLAFASGKSIWASEDISTAAEGLWTGALFRAETFNKNYIVNGITKTEMWSLIESYFDFLPFPSSGPMTAREPWSGHYEVKPSIWAIAHTTQFAQPGWRYIDSASGLLTIAGSFVTFKSPTTDDISVVIETSRAKQRQKVEFKIRNLRDQIVHVWRSTESQQFVQLEDIEPMDGHFSVDLEPSAIYTLTTTVGQKKGHASPPPSSAFPFPYREDFQNYQVGKTPKFFSDQVGAFEIHQAPGNPKTLRQVITEPMIGWGSDERPQTFIGDVHWRDYEIAVEAMIERSGEVGVFGRISKDTWFRDMPPDGYDFYIHSTGEWKLIRFDHQLYPQELVLAKGHREFAADQWHAIKLKFKKDRVTVSIDGVQIAKTKDKHFAAGPVGLGTGYGNVQFRNFSVGPIQD